MILQFYRRVVYYFSYICYYPLPRARDLYTQECIYKVVHISLADCITKALFSLYNSTKIYKDFKSRICPQMSKCALLIMLMEERLNS